MKRISMLPNMLTLGNAFCGLLAMGKAIEAIRFSASDPDYYGRMEWACWLIVVAMFLDAIDGKLARLTHSMTDFGAQLDSFADAITFGVAPAVLAKALFDHHALPGDIAGHPRLSFLAGAAFSLMAILRLARFNLETEHDQSAHDEFRGLPSPAAAGAVVSSVLLYLSLSAPGMETEEGRLTLWGNVLANLGPETRAAAASWIDPWLVLCMPLLGLLMVSRVRYVHVFSLLTRGRGQFFTLVWVVFAAFALYTAPVPFLFLLFNGFVLFGLLGEVWAWRRQRGLAQRPIDP